MADTRFDDTDRNLGLLKSREHPLFGRQHRGSVDPLAQQIVCVWGFGSSGDMAITLPGRFVPVRPNFTTLIPSLRDSVLHINPGLRENATLDDSGGSRLSVLG